MRLELVLPVFPTDNQIYHYIRGGRVLTKRAREWRKAAQLMAFVQGRNQKWKPLKEWAVVEIILYWPDRKRRDAHNFKILLDTLGRSKQYPEGIAYKDDWKTLPRVMAVRIDKEDPRVELEIWPLR